MDKETSFFASTILQKPATRGEGKIEKGVLLLSRCDYACAKIPELKKYFFLIEWRGWSGISNQITPHIKLIDNPQELELAQKLFPKIICLAIADADFVDTDEFRPLGIAKPYAALQISAWQPFKRHELFVRAAALCPDRSFMKFGHFWNSTNDKEAQKQQQLRSDIIALDGSLGASIEFPFSKSIRNEDAPSNPEDINMIINKCRMGILTSNDEGVNRFKMECLAADIPFLVAADASPTVKKHVNERTGMLFPPTPRGLADTIMWIDQHRDRFSPRKYVLKHSGKARSLAELRKALSALARREGYRCTYDTIYWDGRNSSFTWDEEKALEDIRSAISELPTLK